MRTISLLLLTAAMLSTGSAIAQNKKCPSNDTRASVAIWPRGAISAGEEKTGAHPCGRRMTCIGGRDNRSSRICHWL